MTLRRFVRCENEGDRIAAGMLVFLALAVGSMAACVYPRKRRRTALVTAANYEVTLNFDNQHEMVDFHVRVPRRALGRSTLLHDMLQTRCQGSAEVQQDTAGMLGWLAGVLMGNVLDEVASFQSELIPEILIVRSSFRIQESRQRSRSSGIVQGFLLR